MRLHAARKQIIRWHKFANAMVHAARGGHEGYILIVLQAGATVDESSEMEYTALMGEFSAGKYSTVNCCLFMVLRSI